MDKVCVSIEGSRAAAKLPYGLKDKQKEALQSVLKGNDTLVILPTGYGKSTIFSLLPTAWDLLREDVVGTAIVLVISPLVALMEEQLHKMEDMGIPTVYLGSVDNDPGTLEKVKRGEFPLVLMSPEAVFSGKWRSVLDSSIYHSRVRTIVVDEAHCCVTWGKEFRTDYGRLGDLRSFLSEANVVALTASAPPTMRSDIARSLYMDDKKKVTIEAPVDRTNIMYIGRHIVRDVRTAVQWVADELKMKGSECPKYIIYCRTIQDMTAVYRLFVDYLEKSEAYIGEESFRNRIFAMFHRSTRKRIKKHIVDTFGKLNSILRVVVCSVAFGLGIDVPDITAVIHYGAPRTLENLFQECGRAGRKIDVVSQSYSIVYYSSADIAGRASSDEVKSYCIAQRDEKGELCTTLSNKKTSQEKNPGQKRKECEKRMSTCRRQIILDHFSGTNEKSSVLSHDCCDMCWRNGSCGAVSVSSHTFPTCDKCEKCPIELGSKAGVNDIDLLNIGQGIDKMVNARANISSETKEKIREGLHAVRNSYTRTHSLVSAALYTGLDDKDIDCIVNAVQYIHEEDDLLSEYIFNAEIASDVMDVINKVLD